MLTNHKKTNIIFLISTIKLSRKTYLFLDTENFVDLCNSFIHFY